MIVRITLRDPRGFEVESRDFDVADPEIDTFISNFVTSAIEDRLDCSIDVKLNPEGEG